MDLRFTYGNCVFIGSDPVFDMCMGMLISRVAVLCMDMSGGYICRRLESLIARPGRFMLITR